MSILNVEKLNFSFGDKTILKDVSFRLLKGEHAGLVGVNGAGKTTLFNLLMGNLIPDEGSIYKVSSVDVGYLDQHSELEEGYTIEGALKLAFSDLYLIEKEMLEVGENMANASEDKMEKLLTKFSNLQEKLYAKDFYKIDSLVDNVARGLGLHLLGMDTPIGKLSGGQRTKVKLARLLLKNPDLLLLDEPTNHLDKEHIEWLSNYLINYPNCFIVISHDENFLNRITNVIFHINYGSLNRYPGNYEKFLSLKDDEEKRYIEMYNKQQREIKRMEEFIDKNIVRASTTKRAQSRRKQLEKIERLEKPKNLPKPSFSFLSARESGESIFKSLNMDIGYNYPIIKSLSLKLSRGEKIAIVGCNGIGKSTLLKTIMGIIPPLNGKIEMGNYIFPVYFEQEIMGGNNTPMDEVWNDFPQKKREEIRKSLARCGIKEEHILKKMSALSGGEQAKVRLCKLMMKPSNWLLLDEPTNHLDINAKEALKESLIAYNGTILLVCHEKEFYEGWVTDVWNMEDYIYR
jgi:ATPase subunit of ABC transporter with duplicated ATPase domains